MESLVPDLEPIAERLISHLAHIDHTISRRTQGVLDGRWALLAGFLVAAMLQGARGSWFGPVVPMLWNAAQVLGNGLPPRPHPSERR